MPFLSIKVKQTTRQLEVDSKPVGECRRHVAHACTHGRTDGQHENIVPQAQSIGWASHDNSYKSWVDTHSKQTYRLSHYHLCTNGNASVKNSRQTEIAVTKCSVLFCSLAVLDPRFGHTMDVLSPFISVVCRSDWFFHGESCPRLDVVHPGRAWSYSLACSKEMGCKNRKRYCSCTSFRIAYRQDNTLARTTVGHCYIHIELYDKQLLASDRPTLS